MGLVVFFVVEKEGKCEGLPANSFGAGEVIVKRGVFGRDLKS